MSTEAQQNNSESVNIDDLQAFQFGPKWTQKAIVHDGRDESRRHFSKERQHFDASPRPKRPYPKHTTAKQDVPKKQHAPKVYFKIDFYPEDNPFQALCKAIRQSYKTYELFEIAHLILEKKERFVCVVKQSHEKFALDENQGTPPCLPFYICHLDQIPFRSQEEVLNHVIQTYGSTFFDIEEIQVEGPKGSFPFIHRCPVTQELIGPPNYHRYPELLRAHYQEKGNKLSYERFCSQLVADKTPEAQASWLEKMQKQIVYRVKSKDSSTAKNNESLEEEKEDSPPPGLEENNNSTITFNTLEGAKQYLLSHHKDKIIRETQSLRLSGKHLDNLPKGFLAQAIQEELDLQRHFPLQTANNIRSRLRRLHFNIYKKGSKGISYVSAAKRKFRDINTQFSDSIQKLVAFIDKTPLVAINQLPEKYLGIQKEEGPPPGAESLENEKSLSPGGISKLPENPQIRQLMIDLHWLVSEGYVTEYANGTLLTSPFVKSTDSLHSDSKTSFDEKAESSSEIHDEENQDPLSEKEE